MRAPPADVRPPGGAGYSERPARTDVAQVAAIVAGPLALLLALVANLALVQTGGCRSGAALLATHAVTLVALLVALGAGALARGRRAAAARGDDERARTMAALGLGTSALSALAVAALWLPLFLAPCRS